MSNFSEIIYRELMLKAKELYVQRAPVSFRDEFRTRWERGAVIGSDLNYCIAQAVRDLSLFTSTSEEDW